jgi:hypothetical protein
VITTPIHVEEAFWRWQFFLPKYWEIDVNYPFKWRGVAAEVLTVRTKIVKNWPDLPYIKVHVCALIWKEATTNCGPGILSLVECQSVKVYPYSPSSPFEIGFDSGGGPFDYEPGPDIILIEDNDDTNFTDEFIDDDDAVDIGVWRKYSQRCYSWFDHPSATVKPINFAFAKSVQWLSDFMWILEHDPFLVYLYKEEITEKVPRSERLYETARGEVWEVRVWIVWFAKYEL